MPSDIAVIGLGVMGRNIALNIADRGHRVAVYNRTASLTNSFMQSVSPEQALQPSYDLADLTAQLGSPRVLFLMVTAGPVVDRVIEQLLPYLDEGDIIIDGGNSFYQDTERRYRQLKDRNIRFLGMGISGGEEGARHGPSIMPGGDPEAWPQVAAIFQSIAARADDGEPCCRWVGEGGAGHYVKMIHNGIEYGDMQLIAETWQLMHQGLGLEMPQLAAIYRQWNQGVLSSYLIEITADIMQVEDPDGIPRVLNIIDAAGQKGTGRWTAIDSLQLGIPLTLITEAVYARALSARKGERLLAAETLGTARTDFNGDMQQAIADIHDGLYAAKIISYTQGFMQMREAAREYNWQLDFGEIALLWRAGCIIRSRFLDDIKKAFGNNPDLQSLLLDDFFTQSMHMADKGWRNSNILGIRLGIALPALSSALNFFDAYRSPLLPANLLQAQRDYFGAHTYRRLDAPPDASFHTHWATDGREEPVNG